jgi:hypothetical protein
VKYKYSVLNLKNIKKISSLSKIIFFFEQTKMEYINIMRRKLSPQHKMCQEKLQQSYNCINTKKAKAENKTLVDAQTKQ